MKILKSAVAICILLAATIFFYREFQRNWTGLEAYHLKFNVLFVLASGVAVLATCLLTTYGWFFTMNALSTGAKLTFPQCIAIVNTSNLTKYLPGKVWSYALQTYWLRQWGISNALILYVYFVNMVLSLLAFLLLGACMLVFVPSAFPIDSAAMILLGLIILDFLFVRYNGWIFNKLIWLMRIALKRDIAYFQTSQRVMIRLHVIYIFAALSFGLGAYLLCFGIGLEMASGHKFLIMSSMMISDVIGFLAIFVPGGLGVREGVMYVLLSGVSSAALSLILPIATRIVNMLVDISLGLVGFFLLRKYSKTNFQ